MNIFIDSKEISPVKGVIGSLEGQLVHINIFVANLAEEIFNLREVANVTVFK